MPYIFAADIIFPPLLVVSGAIPQGITTRDPPSVSPPRDLPKGPPELLPPKTVYGNLGRIGPKRALFRTLPNYETKAFVWKPINLIEDLDMMKCMGTSTPITGADVWAS